MIIQTNCRLGLGIVDASWWVWLRGVAGLGSTLVWPFGGPVDPPNFSVVYRTVLSSIF